MCLLFRTMRFLSPLILAIVGLAIVGLAITGPSYRSCLAAEKEDESLLTLERVFLSGEFGSHEGKAIKWCERRGGYTSLEAPRSPGAGRDIVWYDAASDRKEVLVHAHQFTPPGSESPLSVESYQFSSDESKLLIFTNSRRVWRIHSRGDYWVLDIVGNELIQVAAKLPPSSLMFAKFAPDGKHVAFVHENNLHVERLNDGHITRLTDDGGPDVSNGTFDWVYEEELSLRDGFRWSPNGRQIAFWKIDSREVKRVTLIDNVAGLYPRVQTFPYPKVGETNPKASIGVVNVDGGPIDWLDIPGDPKEHYLAQIEWSSDSKRLLTQQFNRLQNTNRLFATNLANKKTKVILTERDQAWVENVNAHLRWFDSAKQFVWLSERDGWQHAYAVSQTGREAKLLTPGDFDVIEISGLDPSKEWLYFIASPQQPTQRYLFRAKLDGSKTERLTPADAAGWHTYRLSPDGKYASHSYSTFSKPPRSELVELPSHRIIREFSNSDALEKKLEKLTKPESELFRVDIGGTSLDGWCIRPPKFDPQKKYPVLFHVYGEPAGQTVQDRWGGRDRIWYWMLAQRGFVVMSIDNRGTASPRGREWRKCIYRQIGILTSADQAAAVQALLRERPYLDAERVAIWGWSGGGSSTLNALFRYPNLYKAGIAVAPVPNQRLYDTIYQERYMGLPGDNAEGYRLGSPITFAHQLTGRLLLIHGTGDDNCHYQGTEALINELIAHNKQFRMFAYPGRSHGIYEGKNTTFHLHKMITDFLFECFPSTEARVNLTPQG